jgi:hypothetical protein
MNYYLDSKDKEWKVPGLANLLKFVVCSSSNITLLLNLLEALSEAFGIVYLPLTKSLLSLYKHCH